MEIKNEEFSIANVISRNLINLTLDAKNKKEAIKELSEMLLLEGKIDNLQSFVIDVFNREKEGITGLGEGVAIPHGKSNSVVDTSIAVGRTRTPIFWESLDDKPVNLIILFAVRNTDANTVHIKLLQKVARLLADEDFISNIKNVSTVEGMMDLLSKEPEN